MDAIKLLTELMNFKNFITATNDYYTFGLVNTIALTAADQIGSKLQMPNPVEFVAQVANKINKALLTQAINEFQLSRVKTDIYTSFSPKYMVTPGLDLQLVVNGLTPPKNDPILIPISGKDAIMQKAGIALAFPQRAAPDGGYYPANPNSFSFLVSLSHPWWYLFSSNYSVTVSDNVPGTSPSPTTAQTTSTTKASTSILTTTTKSTIVNTSLPSLPPTTTSSTKTTTSKPTVSTTTPTGIAVPPMLISPASGAIVNNGSYDHSVGLNWEFDWSDVPGSTSYELYVMHIGATIPFLDIKTNESKYTTANNNDINTGYIADVNRKGWTWKVRALVNVQWSDWSETSIFDVAPLIATTSTTTISTTQITTTPVTQNLPNTGSKIAFVSDRDGKWAIYAMNADGSNQVRLTDTNFDSFRPVWSPDSTKIAFSSGRNGPSEIYVMSADGGNQRKLTNNIYCDNPAWSTDGTKIAYRCDSNGPGGVYVMNADGTNQTSLNVFTYDHVVWSPDSQKIAFSPVIDSTIPSEIAKNGIYIMKADGSNIT
jgi:hypothetical protein